VSVTNLVKKALEEINEKKQSDTESRVRTLVNSILSAEAKIAELQAQIVATKKELKELQLPTPSALEF